MDALTCVPIAWRGQPATLIIGSRLEVVVSLVGGHLACLRLRGEELSPLWQPPWPGADPRSVQAAPSGPYGDGAEAILLASITGSNLCCDRFGAPWPGERRPLHGEAGVALYQLSNQAPQAHAVRAHLPEANLWVTRQVQLDGDEVVLATTISHQQQLPRPVEWCEHTNLGDPFLAGCTIRASVDWAVNLPGTPEPGFAHHRPQAHIPIDEVLAVPEPGAPPTGAFAAAAVSRSPQGFWEATNPRLGRRLRVHFDAEAFPWLGVWTQHRSRTTPPWNGRTRVRGMELSTKPFPEGQPPASRASSYRGRPTVCLVPPGPGLTKTIRFRWQRLAQAAGQ